MPRKTLEVELPTPTLEAWGWATRAHCRKMPLSLFYPDSNLRNSERCKLENAAKAVCRQCPVAVQCLAHAQRSYEPFGIWGGLTDRERASARNRRPQ